VTACARGNNAACDRLASDPGAVATLTSVNKANGMSTPASQGSWWQKLGLKARQQSLYELSGVEPRQNQWGRQRTQVLSDFVGEHWPIPGVDSLPAESSGNSLFDFGIFGGTPSDRSVNSPEPGTLDRSVSSPARNAHSRRLIHPSLA